MTNKDFKFRINSNRMPPRGMSNPFLHKACGEIIEDKQGESIVVFQLKKGAEWIFYYFLYLSTCFDFIVEPLYFIICIFFGCLFDVLLRQYWKFVGRRVKEWLEELFETNEDKEIGVQADKHTEGFLLLKDEIAPDEKIALKKEREILRPDSEAI